MKMANPHPPGLLWAVTQVKTEYVRQGLRWELQESDGTHMVWFSDDLYPLSTAIVQAVAFDLPAGHRLNVRDVSTGEVAFQRV